MFGSSPDRDELGRADAEAAEGEREQGEPDARRGERDHGGRSSRVRALVLERVKPSRVAASAGACLGSSRDIPERPDPREPVATRRPDPGRRPERQQPRHGSRPPRPAAST